MYWSSLISDRIEWGKIELNKNTCQWSFKIKSISKKCTASNRAANVCYQWKRERTHQYTFDRFFYEFYVVILFYSIRLILLENLTTTTTTKNNSKNLKHNETFITKIQIHSTKSLSKICMNLMMKRSQMRQNFSFPCDEIDYLFCMTMKQQNNHHKNKPK